MAETSETYIHQKDPIHSMDKMTQIMSFKVRWNALAHLQALKKKRKKKPEELQIAEHRRIHLGHLAEI